MYLILAHLSASALDMEGKVRKNVIEQWAARSRVYEASSSIKCCTSKSRAGEQVAERLSL